MVGSIIEATSDTIGAFLVGIELSLLGLLSRDLYLSQD